jgi:uncharacterized repeat protein (TIGR01451 family)
MMKMRPVVSLIVLFTASLLSMGSLLFLFPFQKSVRANGPWYVTPNGNNSNSCQSPAAPCATINGAIGKASSGDTIYVATGTYTSSSGDEVVLIDKNVTISGGWSSNFTQQQGHSIIDGDLARQGIFVTSQVETTIDHLIIENGFNGSDDSARSGSVSIEYGANVSIDDSIIRKNGTGIANVGNLILNQSIVSYNTATGIVNNGSLEINNSTIYKNTNKYSFGGGIYNLHELTINNSTISSNSTNSSGGGIINSHPSVLNVNNSTITGNFAGIWVGGIYSEDTIILNNSIIAGNQADQGPDCDSQIQSLGYNIIGDVSECTVTATNGDKLDTDPKLGLLIGKPDLPMYHPLLPSSPAIDAGNPSGCFGSSGILDTDQRGAARVGNCDIGAYEFTTPGQPDSISILQGSPQHAKPLTSFRIPIQVAVLDSLGSPVNGISVTFTAPSSGPSGSFIDTGTQEIIDVTTENGIASASSFTANIFLGDYDIFATVGGGITPALFEFSNSNGIYVSPAGDDSSTCLYPNIPCSNINIAIEKSIAGDALFVTEGSFFSGFSSVVYVDRDLALSGGWNNTFSNQVGFSFVDGQDTRAGIVIESEKSVSIENFVIQNGGPAGIGNEGNLTLDQVIVRNNQGYGILNSRYLNINNSSITQNAGDGIYNIGTDAFPGKLTVSSSAIIANSGIGVNQIDPELSPIYLQNTIISRNEGQNTDSRDCSGTIISSGYNLIGDESNCNYLTNTGDLFTSEDGLGVFVDDPGYYPLLPSSVAVNAGNPNGCVNHVGDPLMNDLRGAPRYGRCDIGTYELQPLEVESVLLTNRSTARRDDSIQFTIHLINLATFDLSNVELIDSLPDLLIYVNDSLHTTSGSGMYDNGVISWTGGLKAGDQVSITFEVRMSNLAPIGSSILNQTSINDGESIFFLTTTIGVIPFTISQPLTTSRSCRDFFDDFSNPSSGWFVGEDDFVRSEYLSGEYRILSKMTGYYYLYGSPSCDRQDYTVEVDARWVDETGFSYGILFGILGDFDQFYLFEVNSDGQFYDLIGVNQMGIYTIMGPTDSLAISPGGVSNHLKVSRTGTQIVLEINGTILGTWDDGNITGLTAVGLVISPYYNAPISDARFDNFTYVNLPNSHTVHSPMSEVDIQPGRRPHTYLSKER